MTHTSHKVITFLFTYTVLALLSFFFTATETHAYFSSNQNAQSLGNGTALFTIDYSFGVGKHAIEMPITAQNSEGKDTHVVSYSILDNDGAVVSGKTSGIVLSTAPITSAGMYLIPKGVSKKFTLVVLFTPEIKNPNKQNHLQVTNLPFNFDGTQQLQLNPSELQYYATKGISL